MELETTNSLNFKKIYNSVMKDFKFNMVEKFRNQKN